MVADVIVMTILILMGMPWHIKKRWDNWLHPKEDKPEGYRPGA